MRHTRSFEHTPESVPAARHFAREVVRGSAAEVVEAIELMVSELVTNCIRHTDSGFDLAIALSSEQIRVEVTDRGVGEPGMRSPGPSDPTGRGLRIVDMLSTDWGREQRPGGGKTVWLTLTVEASTAAAAAADRVGSGYEEQPSRRRIGAVARPGRPRDGGTGRTCPGSSLPARLPHDSSGSTRPALTAVPLSRAGRAPGSRR